MKKNIIFTIISILAFQFLIAQDYIPLAVEGAHWVIRYDNIETNEPVDGLWEYYSFGDTSINQVDYKRVYKRDLVITQDGPPFESQGPYQLFGAMRDDSISKKVYAIQYSSVNECPVNTEYLLFDFSLQIGETGDFCLVPDFSEFLVENISISDYFGISTKTIESLMVGEIYEGIGSNFGLFEEMFAPLKKSTERYVYSTFLEFYCRESPCWLFVSTPEKIETEPINLFPNPAHDFIYVSNENINSISIFNNVGQEVIRKSVELNKIDVRELKPGLYIIELTMNKTRIQKKIIIE